MVRACSYCGAPLEVPKGSKRIYHEHCSSAAYTEKAKQSPTAGKSSRLPESFYAVLERADSKGVPLTRVYTRPEALSAIDTGELKPGTVLEGYRYMFYLVCEYNKVKPIDFTEACRLTGRSEEDIKDGYAYQES
jgi:hypothetical protein